MYWAFLKKVIFIITVVIFHNKILRFTGASTVTGKAMSIFHKKLLQHITHDLPTGSKIRYSIFTPDINVVLYVFDYWH